MDKVMVAIAGEFSVLSQLALHGYNANMTLGNTKSVDVLALNPKTNKMYQIEVKTNYKKSMKGFSRSDIHGKTISSWVMNEKHEKISARNLFYCFVNISKETEVYRFFVVPSKVVAKSPV